MSSYWLRSEGTRRNVALSVAICYSEVGGEGWEGHTCTQRGTVLMVSEWQYFA